MLRQVHLVLGPRRKGKIPGFASDTLARVYQDAIHGKPAAAAAAGDATSGAVERPSATLRYTPWRNEREVTNHVGEIGVMSRLAYELRERDKAMSAERASHADVAHDHDHGHGHGHGHDHGHDHGHSHGHGHGHEHGQQRHHAIRRGAADPSPASGSKETLFGTPAAAEGGAAMMPDGVISSLEEYHARLHGRGPAPQRQRQGQARGGVRHSGVQLEILGLYRQMLREVNRMQDAETRKSLQEYIRSEYDKNVDLPRKHIAKVEWCMNTAKRKLEDLQRMSPSTKFSMR